MSNPYAEIFKARGAKGFAAAGFIARLPIAMASMGIVAMLSQTHGEYWLAGAVAATWALANAFVSPQVSRLVDRYGQSRVLTPATAISVAAFAGLLLATHYRWPSWTLFAFALAASVMPSMPAMVRARWSALYRDTPQLQTAFAFESVADEVVYMLGSIASVGLSVALFPEAGPLASTIFLAVGTLLFVMQKSTEPAIEPVVSGSDGSAFSFGAVKLLTFILAMVGTIFGTAEVTVIALTREFGQPAAASFILAGYASGSMIVGFVYGGLKLTAPLPRQFMMAMAFMALMTLPLLFILNTPMLALGLFLGGASISPTFITAFGLIERLVPAAKLTEGITWVMTGIGIGMAVGSFASGWMIDQYGAANGFWVSVAAGGIGLLATVSGYCVLTTRPVVLRPAIA
jgi:MFS family permease